MITSKQNLQMRCNEAELVDLSNGEDSCEVDEHLEDDFAETQQFIVGEDVQTTEEHQVDGRNNQTCHCHGVEALDAHL